MNIEFFNPREASSLADLMRKYAAQAPYRQAIAYDEYRLEFAQSFMRLVQKVMHDTSLEVY